MSWPRGACGRSGASVAVVWSDGTITVHSWPEWIVMCAASDWRLRQGQ